MPPRERWSNLPPRATMVPWERMIGFEGHLLTNTLVILESTTYVVGTSPVTIDSVPKPQFLWKRRGFKVLLLTYYWPNAGVHHICGGEGHIAVLAHMTTLRWHVAERAGSSGSVTPSRSPVVTPQCWLYQPPVRGGLPTMSGPSSRGHMESATDPS